jgi:hypothetical protein
MVTISIGKPYDFVKLAPFVTMLIGDEFSAMAWATVQFSRRAARLSHALV